MSQEYSRKMRIWELLMSKWVISEDSMRKALANQVELFSRWIKKTILQILIEQQFIESNYFLKAAAEHSIDVPIWEILIMEWYISQEDLLKAKEIQNTNNKSVWLLLVSQGLLSQENLDIALHKQKESYKKLWDILLEKWYITKEILHEVLKIHYHEDRNIWEVLVTRQHISRHTLDEALKIQKLSNKRIWEILVELGFVKKEVIESTLDHQRKAYKKIWEILINELKVTNIEILTKSLAKQFTMSRIKPETWYMDIELFFSAEKDYLLRDKFIPYQLVEWADETSITVIISDPKKKDSKEIIQYLTGKAEKILRDRHNKINDLKKPEEKKPYVQKKFKFIFWLAIDQEITKFITNTYISKNELEQSVNVKKEIRQEEVEWIPMLYIWDNYYSNNQAINTFVSIIKQWIDQKASDIHIEPFEKMITIRFRIDWVLKVISELPATLKNQLMNAIKSYFKFWNWLKPFAVHDEKVRVYYEDKKMYADLRVSIMPTQFWDKMVLRVLIQNENVQTFKQIWMAKNIAEKYEKVISMSSWIIIVSWPTWSWKTTTLFSTIDYLNKEWVNIITVEDPPEYVIRWVNQVKITESEKQWITYNQALKAVLRQDPDIIMFWEMRDSETAEIAMAAWLTWHLLFTTLHANDTTSSITRLSDLWIKPFMLSSTLVSILSQRLVRKICPHCQDYYTPKEDTLDFFRVMIEDLDDLINSWEIKFKRWIWCENCDYKWFKWRIWIHELLCVNETLKKVVMSNATAKEIEDMAREFWMTSMIEDWFLKSIDHRTTLEEVLRVSRSLQAPRKRRTVLELRRILDWELTKEEIIRSIYSWWEDDNLDFLDKKKKSLLKDRILEWENLKPEEMIKELWLQQDKTLEIEELIHRPEPDQEQINKPDQENTVNNLWESIEWLLGNMSVWEQKPWWDNAEVYRILSWMLDVIKLTLWNK